MKYLNKLLQKKSIYRANINRNYHMYICASSIISIYYRHYNNKKLFNPLKV